MAAKRQEIEIMARGVLISRGHLLLCQTRGADNTYLPGGHIDFGEAAPVALAREIMEELGVESKIGRFLGAVEHSYGRDGRLNCEVNLVFEMKAPALRGGVVPRSCEDYIEFLWHPVDRLRDSRLEPHVLKRLLPRWLKPGAGVERWGSTCAR